MDDDRRCTATAKSTGERCKRAAIRGGTVCSMHGGNAEQVQRKAQERLDRMADETTAEMQDVIRDLVALYNAADPEAKVDIARELRQNWQAILDRTGHGPSETREVTGEGGAPLNITVAHDTRVDDDGDE